MSFTNLPDTFRHIINTKFIRPEFWEANKWHGPFQKTVFPGAPITGFCYQVVITFRTAPVQRAYPGPGWKLYRVLGSDGLSARDHIAALWGTMHALISSHHDFAPASPPKPYRPWQTPFIKKFCTGLDEVDMDEQSPGSQPNRILSVEQSGRGRGEFFVSPLTWGADAPTYAPGGGSSPCQNFVIILEAIAEGTTFPVLERFERRKPRFAGRTALPKWIEQHETISIGRKFRRNKEKLVESPNDNGFGNDGTRTWKDGIRDAAKRVAVGAAKSAVASATKSLTDAAAKKAGARIKKRASSALKEILRKR